VFRFKGRRGAAREFSLQKEMLLQISRGRIDRQSQVETDQGEIAAEAICEMSLKEEANVKMVIGQFCRNRTKLHQLRGHGAGIVCEIPVFGELK
jgi:hypothetical protein